MKRVEQEFECYTESRLTHALSIITLRRNLWLTTINENFFQISGLYLRHTAFGRILATFSITFLSVAYKFS